MPGSASSTASCSDPGRSVQSCGSSLTVVVVAAVVVETVVSAPAVVVVAAAVAVAAAAAVEAAGASVVGTATELERGRTARSPQPAITTAAMTASLAPVWRRRRAMAGHVGSVEYQRRGTAVVKAMGWVLGASFGFAVGGALMKASEGFQRVWPSVAALACFLVGAVLLTMAVRVNGLTAAYTIGLGLEAVLAVGLGRFLYDEPLGVLRLAGVAMILAGIASVRFG